MKSHLFLLISYGLYIRIFLSLNYLSIYTVGFSCGSLDLNLLLSNCLERQTSHSCAARNKDEYVPATSPSNNANANERISSPPKINNASAAKMTVKTVLIERDNVCSKLVFTIFAKSSNPLDRKSVV